jgi:hypothetical protein
LIDGVLRDVDKEERQHARRVSTEAVGNCVEHLRARL